MSMKLVRRRPAGITFVIDFQFFGTYKMYMINDLRIVNHEN